MADARGRNPGDPGYDGSSDPNNATEYNTGGALVPAVPPTDPNAVSTGPPIVHSINPSVPMDKSKIIGSPAGGAGGDHGDVQWIYDALAAAHSTDDPMYWVNKWRSGELGTDQGYVIGRIKAGDGVPGAKTGATDPTTFGKLLQGFPGYQAPTAPPAPLDLQGYAAPTPFGSYTLPTGDQVRQTPGYQFGLDQSIQGFTNAKAAQGVARTGGTLSNILDLAGNYADQHYGDYVNQDLAGYNANRETYATNEAGRLGAYTANNAARQQVQNSQRQGYLDQYGIWRNTNNDQFGYLDALYGTGAGAAATA